MVLGQNSWGLAQKISVTKVATCGAWVYASFFYVG
jgi:hypothetical protein